MKCLNLQIGYGIVGVFIGFSVFVCFAFEPHMLNRAASLWGLLSGIIALVFVLSSILFFKYWTDPMILDHINTKTTSTNHAEEEEDNERLVVSTTTTPNLTIQSELMDETEIKKRTRVVYVLGATTSIALLISLSGFICYLVVAGIHHQKVDVKSDWVTAVWAFMSMKWSFALINLCYRYWNSSLRMFS